MDESDEYKDLYSRALNAFDIGMKYLAIGQLTMEDCGLVYSLPAKEDNCYNTYLTSEAIWIANNIISDLHDSSTVVFKILLNNL